jgi:hypothetical protein
MRFLVLIPIFWASVVAGSTADARSLQISGVTGYISDYQLSASVSSDTSGGVEALSGPLVIKHVGLCTHEGPNETVSQIRIEFVNEAAPVIATLQFDGHECSYRGPLSETRIGVLACDRGLSLPLRLWSARGSDADCGICQSSR